MAATVRPVTQGDNEELAQVLREVLVGMGVPKVGTAYADKALDEMYQTYQKPKAEYFVVEENGKLLGGAGIAQLQEYDGPVCELQKMYLLEKSRGRGLGAKLMDACLAFARAHQFKQVYIETMPYMDDAQKLYRKYGFEYIDGPMGNTGHYSCPVHMLKTF